MRIAVLFAVIVPALPAARETVALLPVTGANVHQAYLDSATEVLRIHLEQTGRFDVVRMGSPGGPGQEPTPAQAAEVARAAGAQLAVAVRVVRQGQEAGVRLLAYEPDGSLARVDEMVAGGPDDLDPVLQRLAAGLAAGLRAHGVARIDPVTPRDPPLRARTPVEQLFGIRLGAVTPVNRAGGDRTSPSSGGGIFWLYDAGSFLADVSFDFHASNFDPNSNPDRATSFGLGVYRPLQRAELTPYAGGGLAYTWSRFGGEGASGLTARGVVGFLLGRSSTVVVRAEIGWFGNLYPERDRISGRDRYVNGPLASIGIATSY